MCIVNNEKNRRILIIDDTEAIHEDFRTILGGDITDTTAFNQAEAAILDTAPENVKDGFEVDSAFQGQEGLEKIQQALQQGRPYAMAFVDIRMPPGWDGIETIQRIWKECPDLQVVICTAYADYSWHDIVKKLGETENLLILKKPFDGVEVHQLASALTEKWHLSKQARLKHKELDCIIKQRTQQLQEKMEDLERFNRLAVGREQRMIEFKREINELLRELGREEKYGGKLDITRTCNYASSGVDNHEDEA